VVVVDYIIIIVVVVVVVVEVVVDSVVVVVDSVVVVVGPVVVVVGKLVVVVGKLVVVVVVGPAHVPSAAHASNLLKRPRKAPQALPFLHWAGLLTIDDLTWVLFLSTQHTAASSFPQIDAFSHFMMSLRHDFCGMRAVMLKSLSVIFTHFLYFPCV
jgi:hypothetical protein